MYDYASIYGALKRLLLSLFLHKTTNTYIATVIYCRLPPLFLVFIFSILSAQSDGLQSPIVTSGSPTIIRSDEIHSVYSAHTGIHLIGDAQLFAGKKTSVSKSSAKQSKIKPAKIKKRIQKSGSAAPPQPRIPKMNKYIFNLNSHNDTVFSTGTLHYVLAVLNNVPAAKAIAATLFTIFLILFFFYSRVLPRRNRDSDTRFFLRIVKVRPPPY